MNGLGIAELKKLTNQIRGKIVEMSYNGKAPHLGSALSCVDILTALYFDILSVDPGNSDYPNRDRFILSKGHAASALYAVLAYKGFFPLEDLESYAKNGSCLAEHPGPYMPGIEVATGSLGHGLPIGVGMALTGRLKKNSLRVFVLMSDGECNEGSVWEAAMLASSKKLGNVIGIIDYNKWQATGRSREILALEPLKQKWESFGWSCHEVDGHDLSAIIEALKNVPENNEKPVVIIAHTVKGKGVSFMEDDNNWHYRIPTEEEVKKARTELGL
ncbi:transketolase [Candidatus Woesearchaeota archaeon]|nr:transketolase [Candidatus Woesearchaeota archaeon]